MRGAQDSPCPPKHISQDVDGLTTVVSGRRRHLNIVINIGECLRVKHCRWRVVRGGLPGDMPGDPGLPILFVPRRSSGQALPPVQGRHSRHSRPEMLQFGRTRGRPHAPRMLLGPQVLPAGRLGHEARWQTEADYLVSRAARNITLFSLTPTLRRRPAFIRSRRRRREGVELERDAGHAVEGLLLGLLPEPYDVVAVQGFNFVRAVGDI